MLDSLAEGVDASSDSMGTSLWNDQNSSTKSTALGPSEVLGGGNL